MNVQIKKQVLYPSKSQIGSLDIKKKVHQVFKRSILTSGSDSSS